MYIILIVIYLSWSWATCWPVLVSSLQKSLQRSAMIPSANWEIVCVYVCVCVCVCGVCVCVCVCVVYVYVYIYIYIYIYTRILSVGNWCRSVVRLTFRPFYLRRSNSRKHRKWDRGAPRAIVDAVEKKNISDSPLVHRNILALYPLGYSPRKYRKVVLSKIGHDNILVFVADKRCRINVCSKLPPATGV